MYKVMCDGKTLHNDELQQLKISGGKATLEIGKSGLFEFTIYPDHPYYDTVKPVVSIIEVYRNEKVIFRGRALNVKYGFYNEKQVSCEGELAFLLDSIVAPHAYYSSFTEYLDYIIAIHNGQVEESKQFERGNVTVAEFYPFEVVEDYNFNTSYDTINQRMVERSGGYLQARHENGTMYLDLLVPEVNISNVSTQKITLGKNLLDIKRDVEGAEVFSGIIPLGAKVDETEKRLDISSINSGSYSIENTDAVAVYGKIYKVVIFENISNVYTLLSEAQTYLSEKFAAINTIEIMSADLSGINPELDSFSVGQWVVVESEPHFNGVQQTFLIRKMTISLSNPADTKIEVGRSKQGLTDRLGNVTDNIGAVLSTVQNVAGSIGNVSDAVSSVSDRVEVLEGVQPYVMESGTTGIFTWKKFSDNTCEFFGKIPVTSYDITTALGNWYRGANLYEADTYPYPFTMTEAPAVNMTFQTRNGLAAIAWIFSQDAETAQDYLPQCYLIRPVTGSGIYGNLNIVGKGKL